MSEHLPEPSVRPTTWRSVLLAAMIGAALGRLFFAGLASFGATLPRLPVGMAGTIAVVAAVVGWLAFLTHREIHRRHNVVPAGQAVVLLALAKTAALVGAALAGAYAAIAIREVPALAAEFPRERALSATLAFVASIGLGVAGILLERACRIPNPPPDDKAATPGEEPPDDEGRG